MLPEARPFRLVALGLGNSNWQWTQASGYLKLKGDLGVPTC